MCQTVSVYSDVLRNRGYPFRLTNRKEKVFYIGRHFYIIPTEKGLRETGSSYVNILSYSTYTNLIPV